MIEIGDFVKMSQTLKNGFIKNDCKDHVKEFGDCEGVVEIIDEYKDCKVRWKPSMLNYYYPMKGLIKLR